ncbi:putative hmg box protein [Golovinomyces cichoracearum]|uniref:Putative hmg box protein n=1 Tax=Golovinomyces cichoracearum TaxID=62708 RepID=A0A420J1C2_9PEZI|nr:putative hmg box protein [Golovinomyces cichoracearum]
MCCITELEDILTELGLTQYLEDFIEHGFDSWQTVLDITESDFDALGVKLGHRRKIQRKIAIYRGISLATALDSRDTTPCEHVQGQHVRTKCEARDVTTIPGAKRKYRRHPKPDENAPDRPPSAYVIYSNMLREEIRGQNLSFSEIAKYVGERWQNLSPAEKENLEQQAFKAKEKYNKELMEYKKTDLYKEYAKYLADFKAKHSCRNPGVVDSSKRSRIESSLSCNSDDSAGGSVTSGYVTSVSSQADSTCVSKPTTACLGPRLPDFERPSSRHKSRLITETRETSGVPSFGSLLESPISLSSCQDAQFSNGHLNRHSRKSSLNSISPDPIYHIRMKRDASYDSTPVPLLQNEKSKSLYQSPSNSLLHNYSSLESQANRKFQILPFPYRVEDRSEWQLPPLLPPNLATRTDSS